MFLQPQPCIRALKLARGLKKAQGKKISIVFGYLDKRLTEFYGFGDEYFDEVIRLDREDLEGSVSQLVEEYDPHIIHSHNAPDFLTVSALNAVDGTPVIHDVHDSLTKGPRDTMREMTRQRFKATPKMRRPHARIATGGSTSLRCSEATYNDAMISLQDSTSCFTTTSPKR